MGIGNSQFSDNLSSDYLKYFFQIKSSPVQLMLIVESKFVTLNQTL